MTEKPKIQYIGQFYIHGAVAKKLETRRFFRIPKTQLPAFRPNRNQTRYIEPVAIVSILLAVVLVCTMAFGVQRIKQDWAEYEKMSTHLTGLRKSNADLLRKYRAAYDLDAVRSKAIGLGMVPMDTVKTMTVNITPAYRVEPPELSWSEELALAWTTLWE